LVLVVDIVDIGTGRRCLWSHTVKIYYQKHRQTPVFLFWWESACTNRAENKQQFADLMKRVKVFKEKWLISPDGEN